jgi:signal transduction histidine kinase
MLNNQDHLSSFHTRLSSYEQILNQANMDFYRLNPLQPNTRMVNLRIEMIDTLMIELKDRIKNTKEFSERGYVLLEAVENYRDALVDLNARMIDFRYGHVQVNQTGEAVEKAIFRTDETVLVAGRQIKNAVKTEIRTALQILMLLWAGMVIFLGIFTYLLLRTVIRRPMKLLSEGIMAIGEGKLDTRIRLNRSDEWSLIEEAVNRMAADIRTSHTQLSEKNRELEQMGQELEESVEQLKDEVRQRQEAETERARLQNQLINVQKMEAIGTLAGGIAHDFNNLLQGIQGYAELMLLGMAHDHKHYAKLKEIVNAVQKGNNLVRRILTFARQSRGEMVLMNLNRKVEHIKTILERTFPASIRTCLHLSEDLKPIKADPFQIEQVLMNLSLNAKDAMPFGGTLTIETRNMGSDAGPGGRTTEDQILLRVRDTGHGIDAKTLTHIFEPFYTTRPFGKGTGLGLSIVFGIVQQHGGKISCFSEPGEGACFEILLPAVSDPPESGNLSNPMKDYINEVQT